MSTLKTNYIVDIAGGNTVQINGFTPTLSSSLLTLWVDPNGSDSAVGTNINYPLRTIAAAVAKAVSGTVIFVQAGTYTEVCPIILPRNVAVIGSGLRSVTVKPTTGTKFNNMWLVDSGNYLNGMTFAGHQAGAWAVAFNSAADNTAIGASGLGAYILKSPYIQNCTSYTAEDDDGFAGSTSNGTTGGGMLVDGAACAPNSPIRSMVVDSYTFVNLDGPGCLVTNDAYAQLVSCFGTFCSFHVKTTLGGQVSISNSTTDFGTYGLIANGRSATALFQGTSGGASIGQNSVNITSLTTNRLGTSNKPNTGQVFNVGANYYTVVSSSAISGGYAVTFYPVLTSASTASSTISFFQRSQISTGTHNMEYVGSGTNYNALPWNGGVPVPANQIVEEDGGRVFFSTTDELGNFKVGSQFAVNGTTGEVTINSSSINLSGVNQIGPFSRDGGITTVGVVLREVSSNNTLFASTGTRDTNTVPTQSAVYNYLLNTYAPLTGATLTNATLAGTLTANGSVGTAGQFLTTSTTGTYWSTVIANTNLTLASNSSTISVNSDTGTDVTILAANATTAGVLTADAQTIGGVKTFSADVILSAALTANGTVGTAGQVLTSNAAGVYWAPAGASTATYNVTIGDGSATSFTITHSLNKANIFVSIRDVSTGYFVYPDIRYTSTNAVVLEFVDPPTSSQYYVAVIGA